MDSTADTVTNTPLGISVHALRHVFLPEVKDAGLDETSTIVEIKGVFEKKGAKRRCPRDGRMGAAYVDCIEGCDIVGPAEFILSYMWGYSIGDIIESLELYCEQNKKHRKSTYIWICCLCHNQHRVNEDIPPENHMRIFKRLLKSMKGGVIAMMTPWDGSTYLTRTWLLVELYTTHEHGLECTLIMPPREYEKFLKATDEGNVNDFFTSLVEVDIEKSKCVSESDKGFILDMIRTGSGFEKFNSVVINTVAKYLVRCYMRVKDVASEISPTVYTKRSQQTISDCHSENKNCVKYLVRCYMRVKDVVSEISPTVCTKSSQQTISDCHSENKNYTPTDSELLGVSVHYLSTKFMQEVRDAGYNKLSTIYQIEETVIRGKGTHVKCPLGEVGAAYVHCLKDEDDVGKSTIMLSYAWQYPIGDIIDTLVGYCHDEKLNLKRTYIWICCLCNNQHRVQEQRALGKDVPFEEFRNTFESRVKTINHIVPVMMRWETPTYLERVWCIFEMFTASTEGCRISIAMPPSEKRKIAEGVEQSQMNNFFKVLAKMDVEKADTTVPADKESIFQLIENGPGYDELNLTVMDLVGAYIVRCYAREHRLSMKVQERALSEQMNA